VGRRLSDADVRQHYAADDVIIAVYPNGKRAFLVYERRVALAPNKYGKELWARRLRDGFGEHALYGLLEQLDLNHIRHEKILP